MGKIDDACMQVVARVEGAVAASVVDLDTGMLLGIFRNAQHAQTLSEMAARAARDLFRGGSVGQIEQMVRQERGLPENADHSFGEVHITSQNNFHFLKTLKDGKAVLVLVTKKMTNIGMGWAQLKAAISTVELFVP